MFLLRNASTASQHPNHFLEWKKRIPKTSLSVTVAQTQDKMAQHPDFEPEMSVVFAGNNVVDLMYSCCSYPDYIEIIRDGKIIIYGAPIGVTAILTPAHHR